MEDPSSLDDSDESAEDDVTPRSVTNSFWVWVASSVVGMTAAVFAVTRFGEIKRGLEALAREQQLEATPEQLDTVASAVVIVTLGAVACLIVVQLVLASLMWVGRNWARGALVAAAVLSLVALVVAQDIVAGLPRVGFLLQAVLMIVASVLMFLPDSNSWFRGEA